MIVVRPESREDIIQIRNLNEQAFGQPAEAGLVDKLRQNCPEFLSLVAVEGETVVGHILFTPAVIEDPDRKIAGMGLAPMAVAQGRQRQGIGAKLVRRGIEILREKGCPFVIVLGHPGYYPRFGFEPASKYGLSSQWQGVPDEAFMALVMEPAALKGVSGVARYRAEFDEAI